MMNSDDIKSLGFTLNENCNWFTKETITIAAANIIYQHSDYIQIWKCNEKLQKGNDKSKCDLLLFQGKCRSKEELIVLLEQVSEYENIKINT